MRASRCRSCEAAIVWTLTRSEKIMPIDAEPSEEGTFYVVEDEEGRLRAYAEGSAAEQPEPEDERRYQSHFATCPNASRHRRSR